MIEGRRDRQKERASVEGEEGGVHRLRYGGRQRGRGSYSGNKARFIYTKTGNQQMFNQDKYSVSTVCRCVYNIRTDK